MTGQEAVALVHGMTLGKVIAGYTPELAVKQAIEDVYAIDIRPYLRQAPAFATTAGKLVYTFAEAFGSAEPRVRRARGLYDKTLASTANSDQSKIEKRAYAADDVAIVDNLERTITFLSDPGDTTGKWALDYFLAPPVYSPTAQLPVLKGWEHRLIVNGALSVWEKKKEGSSGSLRSEFEAWLGRYITALQSGDGLRTYSEADGVKLRSRVTPR